MDRQQQHRRLHAAVSAGDLTLVQTLLQERGFLPDEAAGYTPSLGGPNDLAERDHFLCDTPLMTAARSGSGPMVRLLLDAGADHAATNVMGAAALHHAAEAGNRAALGLLLDDRASVSPRDNEQLTPLHLAAMQGHSECAEALLDAGAPVLARDALSLTPLHRAAASGHALVVKLCLAVEPEALEVHAFLSRDLCSRSPLPVAAQLHDDFLDTAVVGAVRRGEHKVVAEFVDAGLDVCQPDAFDTTLLQLASYYGQPLIVR